MENIKSKYAIPVCSDDYGAKLYLQEQFISQIINQIDIKIPHLGISQDRLKDRKVLVVLDDVDRLVQLEAMAKETFWFGPWSRIIITTQDREILKAHGINHIYKVGLPSIHVARQMLCMYAFGQKSPEYGFEKLVWEVTILAGNLPLGLRIMGSYFRGMPKQEWKKALPSLRTRLDGDIESILKFSYDALCDDDKDLFLYIACFFIGEEREKVQEHLSKRFSDVRQRLDVLTDKSLIYMEGGHVRMHDLLAQLGSDIVRKQSICEPGKRQFLVNRREICEVLVDDAAGSRSVVGIELNLTGNNKLDIGGRAFEGMSNLQFLRIYGDKPGTLHMSHDLNYLSPKLRLLDWIYFPMKCFPSNVNLEFLVELIMCDSKLENLWEGNKLLMNLKWMDLSYSVNLKELPNLSTASSLKELYLSGCSSLVELPSFVGNALIDLQELDLSHCSSLIELPSSIGNAINLQKLHLRGCSNLVELPSSVGNATNLQILDLSHCSNLVKLPSSLGNLHRLGRFLLQGCSKLKNLPSNINLKSLRELDLTGCSLLKTFPEISTNISYLYLIGTSINKVPSSIRRWSHLEELHISYSGNLKNLRHAYRITELHLSDTGIEKLCPLVKGCSGLRRLVLKGFKKLLSLPQLPDFVLNLCAENCESLEKLDCSFRNPWIVLNFGKCYKLNKKARDLIIQRRSYEVTVLPGGEIPTYFTYRANGGSVIVKSNERTFPTSLIFKACILLISKNDIEGSYRKKVFVDCVIIDKQESLDVPCSPIYHILPPLLTEHLYIFEFEADVTSNELVFEIRINSDEWDFGIVPQRCPHCNVTCYPPT